MKFLVSLTAVLLVSTAAFAQSAMTDTKTQMMMDKIDRLEKEIVFLQRRVYQEPTSGIRVMGSANAPVGTDELYSRIADQESVIADLTRQLEKANFELTTLTDRVNKINADVDMRFQLMAREQEEQRQAAVAAAAAVAATKTTPKIPPAPPAKPSVAKNAYDAAYDLLKKGVPAAAEAAFAQFLIDYPNEKLAGNANYWLGETYYARGQFAEAVGIFAEGVTKYKSNIKAPDSLFKLGMSLKRLNKESEACAAFKSLPVEFPKADKSLLARALAEVEKLSCQP